MYKVSQNPRLFKFHSIDGATIDRLPIEEARRMTGLNGTTTASGLDRANDSTTSLGNSLDRNDRKLRTHRFGITCLARGRGQ
jgi:hypothetical protein